MVWGQCCREKKSGEEWLSASSHRCSFPSAVITQTRAFKSRYLILSQFRRLEGRGVGRVGSFREL